MHNNLIVLLKTRRFLPLFLTQFLGAFNDNLFKNALVVLITYKITQTAVSAETLVALSAGIFIFPFFIFSATAGQIADKFEKAILIRIIKSIEILAMLCATAGFMNNNLSILIATLFFLGTHSAFFGPLKYAILPDHLHKDELLSGNALVEASTFLAILLGTIFGGILIMLGKGDRIVSILGIAIACLGLFSSFFIPKAQTDQRELHVSWNLFCETGRIVNYAREDRTVFLCILGISWFWLIGAAFLAQIPGFTKNVLSANSHVVTLFLTLFSIGIAIGSLLCARIQHNEVSAKYVPISIFAMTLFILDLFFASSHSQVITQTKLIDVTAFLTSWNHWRIMIDILLISISGGIYIVPLYTMMQSLAKPSHRSRVVAANNILNALFMVLSALMITFMLALNFSIPQIFLMIAILNAGAAIYICKLLPEALIKTGICWLLKSIYRVKVKGIENYKKTDKRAIIIANHISFLDALLISAFLPNKFMFVVNTYIAKRWWLKPLLGLVDAFPLNPTDPMALRSLIKNIQQNKQCLIFPEGRITVTGALMKIYEGPAVIADKAAADILPIRIDGAQYTFFSRLKGKVRLRWFPQITITILPPRKFIITNNITGRQRRQLIGAKLYDVMTDLLFESSDYKKTLPEALYDAKKIHGGHHIILEDNERQPINYRALIQRSFILGSYISRYSARGDYVGLLLPNRLIAMVCFFASQFYGRIPAMLNFSMGSKAVLHACSIAKLRVVYTSKQFITLAKLTDVVTLLTENNIHVVYLEELGEKINWRYKLYGWYVSQYPYYFYRKLNPGTQATDPAVVLFTSGSEGNPKGVVLSHQNIQANRYQLSARVDFTAQDIVFNSMPIFHAFGLMGGALLPILSGIKTFFYPSPLHYRVIPELVYDTNATIMFGTDTFLSGYARYANPYDFYSVRYVFAGAEKLRAETRKLWHDKFGVRIFEGYGATETSPALAANTPMHNRPETVGRFLPGIQFRLDAIPNLEEGGQLMVSGPNVMLGYLLADNSGELITPPHCWYDTGDIVTVDEAGYVTIKGRVKRFAKIAGEMVSLTAVESYISELWPNQLHAVMNVLDEKKGEALVLVTENLYATRDQITHYFKTKGISELQLPKKVIHVEKMPLLGIGKINYVSVRELVESVVT